MVNFIVIGSPCVVSKDFNTLYVSLPITIGSPFTNALEFTIPLVFLPFKSTPFSGNVISILEPLAIDGES